MERKKIVFACFFGGVVTTALWLTLPAGMIKLLAILAGFCTGYLSYEFREVLDGCATAWKMVTSWRPDREYWRWYPKAVLATVSLMSAVIFPPYVMFFVCIPAFRGANLLHIFLGTSSFMLVMGILLAPAMIDFNPVRTEKDVSFFIRYNFVHVYFWTIPVVLIEYGWKFTRQIPAGLYFTGRFLFTIFKIIHSYKRVLCGVDGMIGGWITGRYLIFPEMSLVQAVAMIITGGLIGAVLGIANWELVSVRLLKVHQKV